MRRWWQVVCGEGPHREGALLDVLERELRQLPRPLAFSKSAVVTPSGEKQGNELGGEGKMLGQRAKMLDTRLRR